LVDKRFLAEQNHRTMKKPSGRLVSTRNYCPTVEQVEDRGKLLNLSDRPVEFIVTGISANNVRGTFNGQSHDVDSNANCLILGSFQAIMQPRLE
jgi:hypothetical protein